MSSKRGASAWSAAIAACAWYSPSWSLGEGGLQDGDALGDELGVPLAAVLLGERHDPSVRSGAAAAARVVQQHQGEQTRRPRDRPANVASCRVSRMASAARSTSPE